MRFSIRICVLVASAFIGSGDAGAARPTEPLDPQRIKTIAAMLPAEPSGPGRPITDRGFWKALKADPGFNSVVQTADKLSSASIPEIPDDLFLEFSRNGNRVNYERAAFSRRNRLAPLVLAECLNNNGTYLPAINDLISALCREKTWVLPAHDKFLTNFNETTITIDLFSSALAWQLATADYLLGDALKPDVRAKMRSEIDRRILTPFRGMVRGERPRDWWLKGTNNWNPVCFSGVTGAALILVPSAKDRAEYVAAAEHYSQYFLSGFTPDGYCSEGLAYWNYGFGMYALMAQNFKMATRGKVDLFRDKGALEPAMFGARFVVMNGVVPAFADCPLNSHPSSSLMWLLNREYGWDVSQYERIDSRATVSSLFEAMLYQDARQKPAPATSKVQPAQVFNGERTVFDEAGIFIFRPDALTSAPLGVAFKGGNNNEHHNHNDIGSYVVVRGDEAVLLDPGRETYTRRTFGPQRYDSKLLNSYGHPVPVIGGKLQEKGKKSIGKILHKEFNETTDTVKIDMSSAYKSPELKKLIRTFEYGRGKDSVFVVTDEVEFNTPQTFETALISLGTFDMAEDGATSKVIKVQGTRNLVSVTLSSSQPFDIRVDVIKEDAPVTPNRLGISLREKVTSATVKMVVR